MSLVSEKLDTLKEVRPLIANARALSLESKSLSMSLFNEVRSKTQATLFYAINRLVREELFKREWFLLVLDVSRALEREDEAAHAGYLGSVFGASLLTSPQRMTSPELYMPTAPRLYVGYGAETPDADYSHWPNVRKNLRFHYVEIDL